jgi:VCBS repeat-containing protein
MLYRGAGNDSDPDGDTLTYSVCGTGPTGLTLNSNGTYTFDASSYDYLADGETTTVNATIKVSDGHGGYATETLSITITGVNDAATFGGDDSGDADEAAGGAFQLFSIIDPGTASGHLAVDDVDGDDTVEPLDTDTAHGHFTIDADGNWTFTVDQDNEEVQALNEGDEITETITVHSADGTAHDITITIHGANDAAEFSGDYEGGVTEDDSTNTVSGDLSVTDVDNAGTITPDAQDGLYGHFSIDGDGHWTYTLDNGNSAVDALNSDSTPLTDTFVVTSDDGTTQEVTITIDGANDAPVADDGGDEGDEDNLITGTATASDVDDSTLTFSYDHDAAPAGFTMDADGNWSLDASDAAYQGLGAGESTDVELDYTVTDGHGGTDTGHLTITVHGVNDAPELTGDAASLANGTEDTDYTVSDSDLLAGWSDADGDGLSVTDLSCDHGTVTDNGDGTYTVTLDENYNGPIAFSYKVTDGTASVSASLNATVDAVNDAPVADPTNSVTTDEDTASAATAIGASDVDGDTLSYSTKSGGEPAHGSVSYDQDAGTFTYTPEADYHGPDSFTIVIDDGNGGSIEQVVSVTVNSVNDAPTASATNSVTTNEDTASSAVAIGASDVDGDSLSYSTKSGAGPAHGSVSYNQGAGTFTYTPAANYYGSDSFTILISDGNGGSTEQVVSVTVNAVDDAGRIGGTTTGSVTEDNATTTATGTLTLTDIDGPSGFVTQTNTAGIYGTFSIDSSGNWTYTLNNADPDTEALGDSNHPTETFAVTANDGATTNVVITVNGHTDAPAYTSPPVYTGTGDPNDNDGSGNGTGQNLTGGSGADTIYGGGGTDTINGNGGDDIIYAGSGNDTVDGNNGGDRVYGGSGNDNITGSNGDDIIVGGYGADTLTGRNGNDTFVYIRQQDTGDTITDFSRQVNNTDKIDLSGGTSTVGAIADPSHYATFYCTAAGWLGDLGSDPGAPAAVGNHQFGYHYNATTNLTTIYIGTDSTAGADMEIYLQGNIALSTSDFLLHT